MRRVTTLLVLFALGATACGADDDEPAATDGPVGTEAPTTEAPTTEAPSTEAPGTDPPATEPPSGGGDGGTDSAGPIPTGDSNSPWCQAAREVDEKFAELDLVDFSDAEAVETTYREALDRIRIAQRFVPPELEQVLETTLEGLDTLVVEFERVDWDFLDVNLGAIDTEALDVAGQELDRYNFYVCGIDNGYDPDETFGDDDFDIDTDQSIRDSVIESLVQFGLTETQAGCIADNVDLFENASDIEALRKIYADCGVPEAQLDDLFGT